MDDKVACGKAILYYRELRGIELNQLAEQIGVKPPVLKSIEAGHYYPTLQQLYDLADAFQITASTLVAAAEQFAYDAEKKISKTRIYISRKGYAEVPGRDADEIVRNAVKLTDQDFIWEPVTPTLIDETLTAVTT